MSADRLTLPADQALSAGHLAERVEAVLAGVTLEQSAVDDVDLADAVEIYRAAGRAALRRQLERAWFQARLTLTEWASTEATFAEQVAPRLDQLDGGRAAWWFLRKYPDWRLRVHTDDHHAIQLLLDDLVVAGAIDRWRPSIYEPETVAFGGNRATAIVHHLFCADSRGVLTYARQPTPGLGRRELSLLLIQALQQHAGLDWFETGDVFGQVALLRPAPADGDAQRLATLTTKLRPLLTVAVDADHPLFASRGPVGYAAPWLAAFIRAGQELGDAAAGNRLERGLRATIAQIVIFHWNRLGLSAHAQGILAYAATAATLPRS
jgi:thiopeptide-type bacteriocin biosynthesis protein